MDALVIGLAAVAVICFTIAVRPFSEFMTLSVDEKWIVAYILAALAYPAAWTFFIGATMWSTPSEAGHFYPFLWYTPACLIAGVIVLMSLSRLDTHIDLAALLQFSALGVTGVFVLFTGLAANDVFHFVFMIVLLLPTVIRAGTVRIIAVGVGCRLSLFVIAISIFFGMLIVPDLIVTECRVDKCGFAGKILTSPFTDNGNVLGLACAVALPLAVMSLSWPRMLAVFLGVVLVAELAGSRTADTGIALTVTVVLLAKLFPRINRQIYLTGLMAGFALSMVAVLVRFLPDQFSYRGYLWTQARLLFTGHELLGVGPNEWATLNFSSIGNLNYSPHNGWWDALTGVGITGTALIVIAIVLKVRFTSPDEKLAIVLFYAALLALSSLESVYVPYNFGIIPCTAVLGFLHTSHNERKEPPSSGGTAQKRVDPGRLSEKGS